MAISTPGDIVLDVVRAADPAAVDAARTRLAAFASRAGDTSFTVGRDASPARTGDAATAAVPEAFRKFEAMVLQSFLQTMLPKDTQSVYGEGLSGEMWQSMLAEKLSDAMTSRGGIGIAEQILKNHYAGAETTAPLEGASADADKQARDAKDLLSVALVQEIQRRTAQSLDQDRAVATVTSR